MKSGRNCCARKGRNKENGENRRRPLPSSHYEPYAQRESIQNIILITIIDGLHSHVSSSVFTIIQSQTGVFFFCKYKSLRITGSIQPIHKR